MGDIDRVWSITFLESTSITMHQFKFFWFDFLTWYQSQYDERSQV